MFDHAAASSEPRTLSHSTPSGPHDLEPGSVPPLPDAGTLLASIGLPSHTIREVLSYAPGAGADG